MLYEHIITHHTQLQKEADSIRRQLSHFPKGKLICAANGRYQKWYQSDGHTSTYLPKKERPLAQSLAYKKFLMYKLKSIEKELYALSLYLRHHSLAEPHLALLTAPGYSELLKDCFTTKSIELSTWISTPYEANPLYPERRIYPAPNGLMVRSKSEVLITSLLFTHNIPFRYEAPLILSDETYYPDFTIRHPLTGDFYYWEHFGMMDDNKYCQRTSNKLNQYFQNNIIPTINLLTTYETKFHPLSAEVVEDMIHRYFL